MGIIIKPLVTEKMTGISEKSNRFGFVVRPNANKLEIKSEIEALYNVTVLEVNTMRYAGKNKSRPQHRGRDTKLLVLLKKLLHRYQKNLLYMESVLQVVVTM